LEIIKAADPDILGIQEAYLWQQDNDAIARQVAQELGMNYYIGASGIPDGGHVVLFTKFQIIEAQNYPEHFTSPVIRGGLHAVLATDSGDTLHVFVVHLRPDSTTEDETSFLMQISEPYLQDFTIIMGDMNFYETCNQANRLRESGWSFPVASGVDQIWVCPKMAPCVTRGPSLNHFNLAAASDHVPVVAEISIYPP
jgi:endonuclease/exonuclease/phosphatase family metal-dependent hydrolase